VPVGVGVPETPTVTVNACAVVIVDEDGLTAIAGVVFEELVTVTGDEPVAVV
jgi:hypothetical protein